MAELSFKNVLGIGAALAAGYFGARIMEARSLGLPIDKTLFTEWNTPVSHLAAAAKQAATLAAKDVTPAPTMSPPSPALQDADVMPFRRSARGMRGLGHVRGGSSADDSDA